MNDEETLGNFKRRIDCRFYSNTLNFTVSQSDVCIDFMQFPPENNEVPTTRIYLSHEHMKRFFDVLKDHPLFKANESKQ